VGIDVRISPPLPEGEGTGGIALGPHHDLGATTGADLSKVPKAVAQRLKEAFGAPADAPLEPFLHNTFWRCMNGQVHACTVGANLPCQERADVSRSPTQGMTTFCQNNPHARMIQAFVTGRATVYAWKCTSGVPEVLQQFAQPDAQGFLSNIWYAITPN
jgi:hypothetical protein